MDADTKEPGHIQYFLCNETSPDNTHTHLKSIRTQPTDTEMIGSSKPGVDGGRVQRSSLEPIKITQTAEFKAMKVIFAPRGDQAEFDISALRYFSD